MGWFFSNPEPEWVTVGTYEPGDEENAEVEVLNDCCTLKAVTELTGQRSWPMRIIDHIRGNHGTDNHAGFALFEQHAPVTGHDEADVTTYNDGSLSISSERGEFELEPNEKIVVTYTTRPGYGHSECISASDFGYYAQHYDIQHIFTRDV
jgi:hypothetical protein